MTLDLTLPQKEAIYAAICNICGASSKQREAFFHHFPECGEYRFQGKLGFGGKIYADGIRVWVDCYQEDRTAEADAAIEKVNKVIERILTTTDERYLKIIVLDAMTPDEATKVMAAAVTTAIVAGSHRSLGHLLLVFARYNPVGALNLAEGLRGNGFEITLDPDETAWINSLPEYDPEYQLHDPAAQEW
jgi:hypothetical protein